MKKFPILVLIFSCLQLGLLNVALANDDVTPPPETGQIGRTSPGGTRTVGCWLSKTELTALIPKDLKGLTANDYPTFFVYIPPNSAQKASFILQDETGKKIYDIDLKNPNKIAGIFSLNMPNKSKELALKVGKPYKWNFKLVCDDKDDTKNLIVGGVIQRIELTQETIKQLKKAPMRDRPAIYAKAGIWYETLTELAELRRRYPQDKTIINDWQNLLKQVELDTIAKEPLVVPKQ